MPPPREPFPPWWLVPNLLALDAPLVAAAWQRFLGGVHGLVVPWAATAALAAAVWAIYLTDRRLDAVRGEVEAERHRFAGRHPRLFATLTLFAALLALLAACKLPAPYWRAGGCLAAAVGVYLVAVHALGGRWVGRAKELMVALGFAAGVTLPLAAGGVPPAGWLPAAAAFAGLCWLNCRLIAEWESSAPRHPLLGTALGVGVLAGAGWAGRPAGAAVAAAAAGLVAVDVLFGRRPRPARVLADVALLTPLLW